MSSEFSTETARVIKSLTAILPHTLQKIFSSQEIVDAEVMVCMRMRGVQLLGLYGVRSIARTYINSSLLPT